VLACSHRDGAPDPPVRILDRFQQRQRVPRLSFPLLL